MSKQCKRKQQGFTLLEVMVVLVILGMLAAVVAPNVLGTQDRGMVKKVQADIALLEQAVDMYKLDNFVFPTTDDGLEALVKKPAGKTLTNYATDGYIKRLPADPWGNPYQYISPGKHSKYDIYSLGSDGVLGGEGQAKDIGNW
jgi:general secretion pathway protein G